MVAPTGSSGIVMEPIGYVHSPYHRKYDAPRQPAVDERLDVTEIRLLPHRNFEQATRDLEGFTRIWVVSWFHQVHGWKPLVRPPRSHVKRGVFATRSPHRPNPMGISVVELLHVRGLCLTVRGTDLLDGTPVLDVKPYLPYADAFPESRAGWVEQANDEAYEVTFADEGQDGRGGSALYAELVERGIADHVLRVLRADPLPHPYKRTSYVEANQYVLAVRSVRVDYTITENSVVIHAVRA